jgi:hypothetical protein
MAHTKVLVFAEPFSPRQEESKWHVTQAMTLLKASEETNKSISLVTYAALEMRQAIEQEMFTIVRLVHRGRNEAALLERCKKKDGLFKALLAAEPDYTNRCYLMSVISEEFPIFPRVANWDIKQLKKLWLELSGYCHSPQSLTTHLDEVWYRKAQETVARAHHYMFSIMEVSKGTGVLILDTVKPAYRKNCDDFLAGKLTRSELRPALRELKNQPGT